MKFFLLSLFIFFPLTASYVFSSQVEFTAEVLAVEVISEDEAVLTLSLPGGFTIDVRVTGETEISNENDVPLTVSDLEGTILKVEGVFTDQGILAEEVQVVEGDNEFEFKGKIESIDAEAAPSTISVYGFVITVPDTAEIRNDDGTPLLFSELNVDQLVKVEGDIVDEGLVASEVTVKTATEVEGERPVPINFEGIVKSFEDPDLTVLIEGEIEVLVEVTPETDVKGDLDEGVLVRVKGTLQEDLSVRARKIIVKRLLQLAPGELKMRLNQNRRVEIILRETLGTDVELTITSLDPSIAQVAESDSTVTIPAGKVTRSFEVSSGSIEGETIVEVQMPAELGGLIASVEVEVRDRGGSEDTKIHWSPGTLNVATNEMAEVRLRLSQPAPAGLMVELELEEEGFSDLVGFPAIVEFAEGSKVAVVEIEVGSQTGEAEIRATLPESLGGGRAMT